MKINKENLLCAMVRADMNNKKLADSSGISANQISNIRQGRNSSYDTAAKLANALGVAVTDLIEDTDAGIAAGSTKAD